MCTACGTGAYRHDEHRHHRARRRGTGGIVSARCLPRKSVSAGLIIIGIRTGAGIWTRCLSAATARPIIYGARSITKAKFWRFLQRAMQRYGRPAWIVTDRLRSYGAAMKAMGVEDGQFCGQWLNNRAQNSPQPFRRRDGAMARFRDIKTLQQFASVHVSGHHHFNHQRHLNRRDIFQPAHAAALAEWRQLAA